MASRSFAPLSSRQENTIGMGRADGLRAHKPGQRLVLGVLTENDQHNRVFGQVSVKGLHFLLQKRKKVTLVVFSLRFHPNMSQLFMLHLLVTSTRTVLHLVTMCSSQLTDPPHS